MKLVPRAGVEPARPFGQRILSPQRLPFRHPGIRLSLMVLKYYGFFLSFYFDGRNWPDM